MLHKLTAPGGEGEVMLADLRAAVASFRRLAEKLESDDSLLGQLLSGSEDGASVAGDLSATLRDLSELVHKINAGEGTLGALINDRTLYDGAEDVLAGVNDSQFARWLLRHYQKKGIKAEETAEPPDSGE